MLGERKVLVLIFPVLQSRRRAFSSGAEADADFKFLLSTALKNSFEANVEKISSRES